MLPHRLFTARKLRCMYMFVHIFCWLLFGAPLCAFLAVVCELLLDIAVCRLLIAAYCLLLLRKFSLAHFKSNGIKCAPLACLVPPLNQRTTQKWQIRITLLLLILLFTASFLPTYAQLPFRSCAAVLCTVRHSFLRRCLRRRCGNNTTST